MTPSYLQALQAGLDQINLQALLAALDKAERARAYLRAGGWTDAQIDHAVELNLFLDKSTGGPCLN